jgi:hypothetical protein
MNKLDDNDNADDWNDDEREGKKSIIYNIHISSSIQYTTYLYKTHHTTYILML